MGIRKEVDVPLCPRIICMRTDSYVSWLVYQDIRDVSQTEKKELYVGQDRRTGS